MTFNWSKPFKSLSLVPFRIGIAGLWLLILYATFGTLVIYCLTAYQLHHSIKSFRDNGEPIAIWKVLNTHKKWYLATNSLQEAQSQLIIVQTTENELASKLSELDASIYAHKEIIKETASRLAGLLQVSGADELSIATLALSKYNLESLQVLAPSELFERLSENQIYAVNQKKHEEATLSLDSLKLESFPIESRHDEAIRRKSSLRTIIENENKKISDLLGLESADANVQIGDYLNSISFLKEFEDLWGTPDFSRMPSDMLTLILVLSMGALGGTIQLTQLYFTQRDDKTDETDARGAGYYLFSPFLGAITALAVFILAKAGVLIIATPGGSGEGAELSPFFIAFIGIISGLLAEQALTTIQRTGKRIFVDAENPEQKRWAFGLKAAMGKTDKEVEENKNELASLLDLSPAVIKSWIEEVEPVPECYQLTVAAFAQKKPRDIFTDLKPD